MRIKELFTVRDGAKVTEKTFGRVLISSVCGMLLCMACLAGTTWAWFAVSIENTGNVIQIGTADIKVTVNDGPEALDPNSEPLQGPCKIVIENSNLPDEFNKKATLYVTLMLDDKAAGYVVLSGKNAYRATVEGSFDKAVKLSWMASWFPPEGQSIEPLQGTIMPLVGETTEKATETAPQPTTDPADGTEAHPTVCRTGPISGFN